MTEAMNTSLLLIMIIHASEDKNNKLSLFYSVKKSPHLGIIIQRNTKKFSVHGSLVLN